MATKKVRPSLWMAGWMAVWAVVSACTALAKDYTSMVVIRFLLGLAEAPFCKLSLGLCILVLTFRSWSHLSPFPILPSTRDRYPYLYPILRQYRRYLHVRSHLCCYLCYPRRQAGAIWLAMALHY